MKITQIVIIKDSTKVKVTTDTPNSWTVQLGHSFTKEILMAKVEHLEAGQLSKTDRATNFKLKVDAIKTDLSV